jgi:hypothetical protein
MKMACGITSTLHPKYVVGISYDGTYVKIFLNCPQMAKVLDALNFITMEYRS